LSVQGTLWLHFEPLQLLNFDFDANPDPDPDFDVDADPFPNPSVYSDAEPDPASQNDVDPDPQLWFQYRVVWSLRTIYCFLTKLITVERKASGFRILIKYFSGTNVISSNFPMDRFFSRCRYGTYVIIEALVNP
jgi:hypothetical protein